MNATPARAVTIALALQGGGAHGAFTWGVLDRLLEEPWLSIEGISATSSGAMNALALAQGWLDGGAQNDERGGARATLEALWESIAAETSALRWAFAGPTGSTAETMLLGITRHFTPKEINPLDFNPVREIAAKLFDFERLREAKQHLFLAATRVRDGRLAMFDREHLSLNALLASVCLPQLFAPVEIDGEMYWDGGYAGNPALEPLIYQCKCPDLLSVLVQPLEHSQPPTTMRQINERIVELGFSTTFTREVDTLLGQRIRSIAPSRSAGSDDASRHCGCTSSIPANRSTTTARRRGSTRDWDSCADCAIWVARRCSAGWKRMPMRSAGAERSCADQCA